MHTNSSPLRRHRRFTPVSFVIYCYWHNEKFLIILQLLLWTLNEYLCCYISSFRAIFTIFFSLCLNFVLWYFIYFYFDLNSHEIVFVFRNMSMMSISRWFWYSLQSVDDEFWEFHLTHLAIIEYNIFFAISKYET